MMRHKLLIALLLVFALLALALFVIYVPLRPWMDRWGATAGEISSSLPGDELVASPALVTDRAVTIQATPQQIFPWLLQLGADKGGMYSYTWLEKLIACPQTNADRLHSEWQDLKTGDPVRMCPAGSGPATYIAAEILPGGALVIGHQGADGHWTDSWAFVLQPAGDGATRLLARGRTTLTGGLWDVIHPGVFFMERGMLLGIKQRVEKSNYLGSTSPKGTLVKENRYCRIHITWPDQYPHRHSSLFLLLSRLARNHLERLDL